MYICTNIQLISTLYPLHLSVTLFLTHPLWIQRVAPATEKGMWHRYGCRMSVAILFFCTPAINMWFVLAVPAGLCRMFVQYIYLRDVFS